MIVVDTSALIDALTGPRRSLPRLLEFIDSGERLMLPTVVLYEWLRGPRLKEELHVCEELFPQEEAVVFGTAEATVAARLYRKVRRPRGREIDLTIAASALIRDAALWTLNRDDFRDIEGLPLV
ncbi:MAG TPA: PIN domain-containing protein [Thermoanaerobaculia bacterium]|nr:PIN domain-containing protein [Thermoanaerobaculia bacterium]